eukprot:256742-Pyramimonas_sp.AAC.1
MVLSVRNKHLNLHVVVETAYRSKGLAAACFCTVIGNPAPPHPEPFSERQSFQVVSIRGCLAIRPLKASENAVRDALLRYCIPKQLLKSAVFLAGLPHKVRQHECVGKWPPAIYHQSGF